MTEDDLLTAVLELAKFAGWRVCHFRPLRTEQERERKRDGKRVKVWRTAVQGDNGWPDLILCGHRRFLVAELKSDTGSLSDDQARWRLEMDLAGIEYHVWRPVDWMSGEIAKVLGCGGGVIPKREEA